jgi:hypothetical protein
LVQAGRRLTMELAETEVQVREVGHFHAGNSKGGEPGRKGGEGGERGAVRG